MNLLENYVPMVEKPSPPDTYSISDFRELQYDLIPSFIETAMNYLKRISNDFFIFKGLDENTVYKYLDVYGYLTKKVTIKIENPENRDEVQPFMTFNLPKLVKHSFFYLNGSYYSPCIYISDKPITYKKNSVKLYGLINSITLFFKVGNTRAIFGGKNIPIEFFLQWFLGKTDPNLLESLRARFKINETGCTNEQILEYFSGFFNCTKDEESINKCFETLFFDDYTRELYKKSYGREFCFKDLIYYAILNYLDEEKQINFVDLMEKRLVFTEILLTPFFQRIGDMAFNFICGQKFTAINFNENEILKHFMVDLKHQFFYDLVNFYSAIQTFRASFVGPNMKQPPSEISSVHMSHFGRICPITISAKKPGENVSIVPGARVNQYGIFV